MTKHNAAKAVSSKLQQAEAKKESLILNRILSAALRSATNAEESGGTEIQVRRFHRIAAR